MNMVPSPAPAHVEAFLSGAYRRILRVTIALSVSATVAADLFFGWRSGLGVAAGSLLAFINFVWLHHGAELMIHRMMAAAESGPSRFRLMLAFAGRYFFVIAISYVILKGYPNMLVAFVVGLAVPIVAAMCEGVYEAVAGNTKEIPN
jgi:ATP synthase I chain